MPTTTTTTTTQLTTERLGGAPVFLFCPESRTVLAGSSSKRVWWRAPIAVDTDGSYVKNLDSTVDSGNELKLGVTLVSYVAKGRSGQKAYCKFNMTLIYKGFSCKDTPATAHGRLECSQENYIYHCHIKCDEGYVNKSPYNTSHKCQTDGWSPPFPPAFDVMACLQVTPKAVKTTLVLKFTGECRDSDAAFRESFITQAVTQLHRHTDVCDVNSVGLCQSRNFDLICGQLASRLVRALSEITLRVTAWLPQKQAESTRLLGQLKNLTESGQFDVSLGGNLYTATSLRYTSTNNTGCPQGWMPERDHCLLCPAGARLDEVSQTCVSCPTGQYQSSEGQLTCSKCPSGRTSKAGSFTAAQCLIEPVEDEPRNDRTSGQWSMVLIIILCVVGGVVLVVTFVLACLAGRRVFRHKHRGKLTLPDAEKNRTLSLPRSIHYHNPAYSRHSGSQVSTINGKKRYVVSSIPDDLKVRSNHRRPGRGKRAIPIGVGGRMDRLHKYNITHKPDGVRRSGTPIGIYRRHDTASSLGWQSLSVMDKMTQ